MESDAAQWHGHMEFHKNKLQLGTCMGTHGLVAKLHSAVHILPKSISVILDTLMDFMFTYAEANCLNSYIFAFLKTVHMCLGFH